MPALARVDVLMRQTRCDEAGEPETSKKYGFLPQTAGKDTPVSTFCDASEWRENG